MLSSLFQRPLSDLSRVGDHVSGLLKKLNLHTQEDLLYHFPVRYEDFRNTSTLEDVPINRDITVTGTVSIIANKKTFRKRMAITEALIEDSSSSLRVVWYNQPYLGKTIKTGDRLSLSGRVIQNKYGLHMRSPQYEKLYAKHAPTHTGRLVPLYASTAGVTQKQIRVLVKQVLGLSEYLQEWLPESIRKDYTLMDFASALRDIHFPENDTKLQQARRRLEFDEMFTIQLGVLQYQRYLKNEPALAIPFAEEKIQHFVATLPFSLTDDQKKAAWHIIQDMQKTQPMNRLLEGDVGSGKTVVAALAAYNCALSGHQAALMCPTEILAEQTHQTFVRLLPAHIRVALLTGSKKQDTNDADIIIGTHALIQNPVRFRSLALAVIDEQHRFGVAQRKALKDKAGTKHVPHLLSMTATPIPRSLALTVYGDLDVSLIAQKPAHRKPVLTKIVDKRHRQAAYDFIRRHIQQGRQAMVICPLIEESDVLGVRSATEEHKKLQSSVFRDLTVGLLHGRMKPSKKAQVMESFKNNDIHVLVSTSVIEVGVDVPNATVMMIEGAERFGLAQLHQFRGRVGRSKHQSYCFLFTEQHSAQHNHRLQALVETDNGFLLAEKDLEIRGAGDTYGVQQSGFADTKIASLFDTELIQHTRSAAQHLLSEDPDLTQHPAVAQRLTEWQQVFHLE